MHGRAFNGTTEFIGLTPAAAAWTGGVTVAALIYRAVTGAAHGIYFAGATAGSGNPGLSIDATDHLLLDVNGTAGTASALTINAVGVWAIMATKPTGTAAVTYYARNLSTGGAIASDATVTTFTSPATTARTIEEIGRNKGNTAFFNGSIFAVASYAGNFGLTEFDQLFKNSRGFFSQASPQRLWTLDQSDPANNKLYDYSPNAAHQLSITGTSQGTVRAPVPMAR